MSDNKKIGWDLGGAEWPHDKSFTVVDVKSPDEDQDDHKDHVIFDLRQDFTKVLEPRQEIKIGQMIRYLEPEGNYLDEDDHCNGYTVSDPIHYDLLRTFGQRLYQILSPKGRLVMFDHIALIEQVIEGMFMSSNRDITIESVELINGPDEDMPGEWQVVITKS